MSNKQSYATAVSKQTDAAAGGSGQGEAPPPYTAPSGSGLNQPPHQTHLPVRSQGLVHQHHGDGYGTTESYHPTSEGGWTPPASAAVAKSRALRRFWLAMMWAWLIWIAVGLLIGGGISDVENNPPGRSGHWDKHGKWHDDRWGYASRLLGKSQAEAATMEQVVVME